MLKMWSKKTKEQEALDALAHYQQDQMRNAAYQSQAQQAQIMGGGGSGLAIGAANAALGTGNIPWGQGAYSSTSRYSDNEKRGIEHRAMLRERMATIKLIEEMAEEVGAPNLLHAIVLAISSRDFPTEG